MAKEGSGPPVDHWWEGIDNSLARAEGALLAALLTAMVGAIVLTHRQRGGVKKQNIMRQVARRPEDAVRITKPKTGEGVEL